MNRNIFALLLASAMIYSCGQAPSESSTSSYKTLTVELSDQTLESEYSALLAGQQAVEIRPQVSGLITKICIGEGEKVRKGQVLFIIDQVPYKAALEVAIANVKSAEARLATAKLTYESTQMLREKEVVMDYDLLSARNDLLAAEASLAQAKAEEVNARNNLSYTEVKSPVNGTAGMIAYRTGALVSSNISEPLVTVSDNSTMYAYFSMTETQILDLMEHYGSLDEFIRQMPQVSLRMSNGKTYPEKGHIAAVSGIVTAGTGAVTIRADFPNGNSLLREGGSGSVIVPTSLENCIVIPQGATYELQERVFAYKVVDGKAKSTQIKVFRLNNGTQYVVESGLQEGDVIIAEGAGLVKEGAAVYPAGEKE